MSVIPATSPQASITVEAPIGSADFNNEYGRPCLSGFFRTLLTKIPIGAERAEFRGYHKPIMLAGGMGTVRPQHALKGARLVPSGAYIVVMGGPSLKIGIGGGAASSQASVEGSAELDFASVQRGNPKVQRRAQEVIDSCAGLDDSNPILFIHDVGAGGLSNGLTELLHDTNHGAILEIRDIDNRDRSMTPMQIWCNKAQERYVLAINPAGLDVFKHFADRERCSYSIVCEGER